MSSRLAHRLNRVARDLKIKYPCRLCRGKGKYVVSKLKGEEPAPIVPGCPECGEVVHIVIRYVDMPAIGERSLCLG